MPVAGRGANAVASARAASWRPRSAHRRRDGALPLRGSRAVVGCVPATGSAVATVSAATTSSGMSLAGTGMSVTGTAGALAVARTLGGAVARRSAVAMTMAVSVACAVALTGGPRRMRTSVVPCRAAVAVPAVGAEGGEASVAAAVGGGDRLPRQPLDVAQQGTLLAPAQRDGYALGAGARGAADAMHVALRHVGEIVVDDVTDAIDVDTARRGQVTADSDGPGQGSTFTVALPATEIS